MCFWRIYLIKKIRKSQKKVPKIHFFVNFFKKIEIFFHFSTCPKRYYTCILELFWIFQRFFFEKWVSKVRICTYTSIICALEKWGNIGWAKKYTYISIFRLWWPYKVTSFGARIHAYFDFFSSEILKNLIVLDMHVYMHISNEIFFRERKRWKIRRRKNARFDAYFARAEGTHSSRAPQVRAYPSKYVARAEGTHPARAALLRARPGEPVWTNWYSYGTYETGTL